MKRVADWFDCAVQTAGDAASLEKIRAEVAEFTQGYPLPHVKVETEKIAIRHVCGTHFGVIH